MSFLRIRPALTMVTALLSSIALHAHATETKPQPPATQAAPSPQPSTTVQILARRPAPALVGEGETAKKNALAFIDWASASTKDQDELVRRAIAAARENTDILKALCEEAFATLESDHSRALITLGLIGEARSPVGADCLARVLARPLPERGTEVEGEILEQRTLAILQAKAIDGLAYLRDGKADELVLNAAGKHASRIVRAEAIAAYLWNHDNNEAARQTLQSVIRKDEMIFLDRLVKQADQSKELFNRQLAAYMKAHPELAPPRPEKAQPKPAATVGEPPRF